MSVLVAVALLDHGMTGVFALLGLFLFGFLSPSQLRLGAVAQMMIILVGTASVCVAWPWYSFFQAVRLKPDNEYWFNPFILQLALTVWAWPAYLCGLAAISVRRPLSRMCLIAAVMTFTIGVVSFLFRSPTLARLPLPAMIFLHIPIGIYIYEQSLFCFGSWPKRVGSLLTADDSSLFPAIVSTMVAMIYLSCLLPQITEVATASHLARPYLAPLLGKPVKLVRYRAILDKVLSPVEPHDVVLSDELTSWMIPSSRGRIVAALHFEFFVKAQPERAADVQLFFNESTTDARRLQILRLYNVRWILLNSSLLDPRLVELLTVPSAVVTRANSFTLLDAEAWARPCDHNRRSTTSHRQSPRGRNP